LNDELGDKSVLIDVPELLGVVRTLNSCVWILSKILDVLPLKVSYVSLILFDINVGTLNTWTVSIPLLQPVKVKNQAKGQ
jgi:hypothetical protein